MSYAVFVDAGYLKHSGARALKRRAHELTLDANAVLAWAKSLGSRDSLLRVYWYDGEFEPGHVEYANQRRYFNAIEDVPGINLRLGYVVERPPTWHYAVKQALKACGVSLTDFERHFTFRLEREQKGVDSLLTLDLVHLAEKRAYDWAVLVAGDRDFAEVVDTAEDEGRRIVVAVPTDKDLAPQLRRGADEVIVIDSKDLNSFFRIK
ncbi:MAG: NYN domain-containing protein [Candidatus Dormibacteraceae bacterium]